MGKKFTKKLSAYYKPIFWYVESVSTLTLGEFIKINPTLNVNISFCKNIVIKIKFRKKGFAYCGKRNFTKFKLAFFM